MREMLNERYATQTKALDAAFLAQQTAMRTAFDAADKAVAAALESAEKAVVKAETAAEKRFESVNEFRAQLTDQAATFISRQEFDTVNKSLVDKFEQSAISLAESAEAKYVRNADLITAQGDRITNELRRSQVDRADLEQRLTSRLDLMAGRDTGTAESGIVHRESLNSKLIGLTVAISVVVILVNIVVALAAHHV
jgi:hypothetical protein